MGDRDRYRDHLGSKQDWAVVGVLLAIAAVPVLAVVVVAMLFGGIAWLFGIEISSAMKGCAGVLLLVILLLFVRSRLL